MDPYKVELQYFKSTGKYYTSGEYMSEQESVYDVFSEVRAMHKNGTLPGLTEHPGTRSDYTVYVNPVGRWHYPCIIYGYTWDY
jgi:hypothetical protein